MNFRDYNDGSVGISIDETTREGDIISILDIFKRICFSNNGLQTIRISPACYSRMLL